MTALATYEFPATGEAVRTVLVDGEPWFVAADVCAVLGIGRQQDSTRHLDEDEKGECLVDTPSGQQRMVTVSEPGLYVLIMRSRKPEAKAFRRWVTHDVLPTIRRDGAYISPAATEGQLDAITRRAKGQMEVLRLADGLVSRDWLEAKARHVTARALGEEPEVDPERRPLTVGEFLEGRGVTGPALRSLSPAFGKAIKRLYRDRHGVNPPKADRFVDGALREVAAYTEADRDLFDAALTLIGATR